MLALLRYLTLSGFQTYCENNSVNATLKSKTLKLLEKTQKM